MCVSGQSPLSVRPHSRYRRWTMTSSTKALVSAIAIFGLSSVASAQTPAPITRTAVAVNDANIRQAVTAAVIRDGKLGLVGTNPRLLRFLTATDASEVYTSETGIKVVARDGRITEIAAPKGSLGSYKFDGALTQDLKISSVSPVTDERAAKAGSTLEVVKISVRSIAIARDGSLRLQATDGSGYTIPNGDYIAADGKKSITMRDGRAVQFLLPGVEEALGSPDTQPTPVAAPIKR